MLITDLFMLTLGIMDQMQMGLFPKIPPFGQAFINGQLDIPPAK